MKSGWTKAFSRVIAGAVCGVGVMALTCGGPTSPATPQIQLSDLQLSANQIQGWIPDSTSNFVDTSIYLFVDGGSSTYCGTCIHGTLKAGFLDFLYKVQSPDTEWLKMFVIDYGTAASAQTIFAGM